MIQNTKAIMTLGIDFFMIIIFLFMICVGFVVLPEVRQAAIDTATEKHLVGKSRYKKIFSILPRDFQLFLIDRIYIFL